MQSQTSAIVIHKFIENYHIQSCYEQYFMLCMLSFDRSMIKLWEPVVRIIFMK